MWIIVLGAVLLCLVFRKSIWLIDSTVETIETKEFRWEIKKASEKLHSSNVQMKSMEFTFKSHKWSVVLACENENIVLTLNPKQRTIEPVLPEKLFLGVGIEQCKGKALFFWHENEILVSSSQVSPSKDWMGPSKEYLLENKDVMLPDDVLTFFVRISPYRSPFCVMVENNQVLKNLSKNLRDLYLESKDHDINIIVRNEVLRAHQVILKARCPVLTAIIYDHKLLLNEIMDDEDHKEIIQIVEEDCDPKDFQVFLLFLYSGVVDKLTNDNVISVYKIADKYDVPDLMDTCANYMLSNLTVHSVSNVIDVALKHRNDKLLSRATDFFLSHAKNIFPTKEWQKFLIENPTKANELVIKSYSNKSS